MTAVDFARVREEFPLLRRTQRGRPLVYLDSAATAQKPRSVIDAVSDFYANHYASIHRGVYELSETATLLYEGAREKVRAFLGAREAREIVFVRNATEAINLVAWSFGRQALGPGDEVLLTAMEHHANIVPWQMLCEEKGARLRVAPIHDSGEIDLEAFEALLGERTRIAAIGHVSNVLGTINPVQELVALAHERGVPVLVDGAQAAPRIPVDVGALDCDFYAVSGHKLYGPSGIGALYARADRLAAMPPFLGGGSMIESVTFEKTTYAGIPTRFEAGSPNAEGAVGLGAALDWLLALGMENVARHEAELLAQATALLEEIPQVRIFGRAAAKTGVLSFSVDGVHPHDVGSVLDDEGVAIRAGHHCAQPLMERYGVPAMARASLGVYNDRADIERLAHAVRKAVAMFD
ncbi:MAG: aminotransferase class V-fold PLP-dependent enzyme [Myxococcota bacterium]